MAADAVAPCSAKPSETMVLTMTDKGVLVFDEEGFQQPV